jgi:hypothetical protein
VQKKRGKRKIFFLQRVGLGHPAVAAVLRPLDYGPFFYSFFDLKKIKI